MSQPGSAHAAQRLRRFARTLRGIPDRLLHPLRRWWARHRLRQLGKPRGVLAVCLGNICRSAYVEASLRRLNAASSAGIAVESAGLIGPDRPSPLLAQEVAQSRGVDLTHHRSRLLDTIDAGDIDLILTMDPGQAREVRMLDRWDAEVVVLGDLDPHRAARRAIRDPFGGERAVFEEVFARIDRCLDELVALWGEERTGRT